MSAAAEPKLLLLPEIFPIASYHANKVVFEYPRIHCAAFW